MLISIVNTPILQPVTHTNYIHLPIPMAHARGGHISNVRQYKCLFKKIFMTPTMSTVTYTKNANFSDAHTDVHLVRNDITVINSNLR